MDGSCSHESEKHILSAPTETVTKTAQAVALSGTGGRVRLWPDGVDGAEANGNRSVVGGARTRGISGQEVGGDRSDKH